VIQKKSKNRMTEQKLINRRSQTETISLEQKRKYLVLSFSQSGTYTFPIPTNEKTSFVTHLFQLKGNCAFNQESVPV
jgi:hypothetical protein